MRVVIAAAARYTRLCLTLGASVALLACTGDRRVATDSGGIPDSAAPPQRPRRLAIDATLTYVDLAGLGAPLRALADSFSAREAVRVTARSAPDTGSAPKPDSVREALADVDLVVDDLRGLRRWIGPEFATWYVEFASDGIVIAHRDSLPARLAVDSTNWWTVLQRRDVRIVRADPDSDATGRLALVVMQLAERQLAQRDLARKLVGQRKNALTRGNTLSALALLRQDSADFAWARETQAAADDLPFLRLPPEIDLSDPSHAILYSAAHVRLPGPAGADSSSVSGSPLVFVVSIPVGAPNPSVAARFVRYLVSERGRQLLDAGHLRPLETTLAVGSGVPSLVAASVDSVIAIPDSVITAAADSAAALAARPRP